MRALAALPGYKIAGGGEDGVINLWRVNRVYDRYVKEVSQVLIPEQLLEWQAHTQAVTSLSFHQRLEVLISGGADGMLKVWRLFDGKLMGEVNLQPPIHVVRTYPVQDAVLVGTGYNELYKFQISTGKELARFQVPSVAGYRFASVFGDERFVAGGCIDGFTCVWDDQSGKLIQKLQGAACTFRPKANLLVTADMYNPYTDKLFAWTLQQKWFRITVEQQEVLQFKGEEILDLAFSQDGRVLVVLTDNGATRYAHVFRVRDLQQMSSIPVEEKVSALLFSPAWYEILLGTPTGAIYVWQCM